MKDCSPNFPKQPAPQSALNGMGEALVMEEDHQRWHDCHPGEPCPPQFFDTNTWTAIDRGSNIMRLGGGGTIEPGDSFAKEK